MSHEQMIVDKTALKDLFKKKHWSFQLGIDHMEYPTVLPEYPGTFENIEDEKNQIWGINLSFGRDIIWLGPFSTHLSVGGFYSKTFKKDVGDAAEDVDLELSNLRTDHMLYAGEARVALQYLFVTKYLNIRPFIEFGVGTGNASIEKEYINKGIATNDDEDYHVHVDEGFDYAKSSIGVQFLAQGGLISYLKVTNFGITKTSRKTKGSVKKAGQTTITDLDSPKEDNLSESEDLLQVSLGMGYLF